MILNYLLTHSVTQVTFTEFGRPFILRSDNGPCYASKEFQDFLAYHGIQHVTSSPHYPQSNGFAEAMVKISKKQMDKSTQERKPWNSGLLEYRCTPLSGTLPLPLEILMNRKPRTSLPQMPGHFQGISTIYQRCTGQATECTVHKQATVN